VCVDSRSIEGRGGGTWAPTLETQRGAPLFRTGRLINSLTMDVRGGVGTGGIAKLEDGGRSIVVGTNVEYARWMQEGTGIYGPTGQRIEATGRALTFVINGKRAFAKSVKGSPKRPFLYIDEKLAADVRDVYARFVMGNNVDRE
jgi:phage gpG-like protein